MQKADVTNVILMVFASPGGPKGDQNPPKSQEIQAKKQHFFRAAPGDDFFVISDENESKKEAKSMKNLIQNVWNAHVVFGSFFEGFLVTFFRISKKGKP